MKYYLEPMKDARKSFYKKAEVCVNGDVKTLYSYGTKVCVVDKAKKDVEIIDFYSQTTTRHIREFLTQEGFEIGDKKFLYYNYTKAGKDELKEKLKEKEEKRLLREKQREEKKLLKEKEKQQVAELKKKIKEDLMKDLKDCSFSKKEINQIIKGELAFYGIK